MLDRLFRPSRTCWLSGIYESVSSNYEVYLCVEAPDKYANINMPNWDQKVKEYIAKRTDYNRLDIRSVSLMQNPPTDGPRTNIYRL